MKKNKIEIQEPLIQYLKNKIHWMDLTARRESVKLKINQQNF